jgi:hypothetical protein
MVGEIAKHFQVGLKPDFGIDEEIEIGDAGIAGNPGAIDERAMGRAEPGTRLAALLKEVH